MVDNHFSINNIPFGVASKTPNGKRTVVTRIYDKVVFLAELVGHDNFAGVDEHVTRTFDEPTLNAFAALPKQDHIQVRHILQQILTDLNSLPPSAVESVSSVISHTPLYIRSFTDFSCSTTHLLNAGEAVQKVRKLPPGHPYFPIGYTGRSSGIVVSGTDIVRPKGMFRDDDGEVVFGASKRLDFELEVAAVVGKSTALGESITSSDAGEYIFGVVLLNDWSARDIQALEMPPLGPMNGKSFATTISPWVVTTLALESFACPAPARSPTAGPYLHDKCVNNTYDIKLEAKLQTAEAETILCQSNVKWLEWTLRDLVAQQTVNGCKIEVGDLLATGTISGDQKGQNGCLLEINRGGEAEVLLNGNERRMWLLDEDVVTLSAEAGPGVGFGECSGRIIAAN